MITLVRLALHALDHDFARAKVALVSSRVRVGVVVLPAGHRELLVRFQPTKRNVTAMWTGQNKKYSVHYRVGRHSDGGYNTLLNFPAGPQTPAYP